MKFIKNGYFVNFPYEPGPPGILSPAVLPAMAAGQSAQVDLANGGSVTSHKVKYTHHVDGNCHFSQSGKIYTSVRNRSQGLLDGVTRHVFTVYITGVNKFTPVGGDEDVFDAGTEPPQTLRIVGRWVPFPIPPGTMNPIECSLPGGTITPGLACCPEPGSPMGGAALVLECFRHVDLSDGKPFNLLFHGGFAPDARDHTKPSTFLGLMYPAPPTEGLPSVDFHKPTSQPPGASA